MLKPLRDDLILNGLISLGAFGRQNAPGGTSRSGKSAHPASPSGGCGPGFSGLCAILGAAQATTSPQVSGQNNPTASSTQTKFLKRPDGPFVPINSHLNSLTADLRAEYQNFYDWCLISTDPKRITALVQKISSGKERYQRVSNKVNGIPWYFIGIVHYREADCKFDRHLHDGELMWEEDKNGVIKDANGAPRWLRTKGVPAGRPLIWPPPSNESDAWVWSAVDALTSKGFVDEKDWTIPAMLWRFERWNGAGYRLYRKIPSPYLWAGSNIYVKGFYSADGKYDSNLVESRPGAAVVLKSILPALPAPTS